MRCTSFFVLCLAVGRTKRPPLRGGSRASGWGRETYLVLQFRNKWQGSLPQSASRPAPSQREPRRRWVGGGLAATPGMRVSRRGEQRSPTEPGAATKLPGRIVNPPLREPKRPPLRGGSRASGWGRETYLVLQFRINARALSLSPLRGQLPHRGSQSSGITTFHVTCRGRRPRRPVEPGAATKLPGRTLCAPTQGYFRKS